MPDDKIYNLWNNIRKYDSKFTVPIEQFRSDMAVDENRKRMHGNMIKNLHGFNVPYDQFSADMGYAVDREGFDVSVTTKPSPDPKPVAKPSMVINKPSLYDTPTVVEQTGWGTPKQKPKEAFEREVIAPGTPIRLASDAEWDADVVEKETAGMTYEQIRAEAAKKRDDVADVRALNKSTSLYEKAWQLNPNDASNPLQIAYNYERLGNIDKALENVNASVSLYEQQTKPGVTDMGNPAAYQMKSRLELMKGDYSSSLSSAQRSIQLQGYALEPDEMSEKNEEAYHNMAVSANYGMTAAEKLGDKDLAEKYKKVYTDASDYSSKIVGAKNLELTRQYIASGQFTKDIVGQIPIMRNVLGVAESMEGFRDAAYDGHILKAVVNTFHAGFAGGMLFNPVAEGEFYLLEKLTPSKYMNMIMQPVSSVAGAFNIKVDDRDQWYKLGDIVGSIILLGAGHKAIKSGLSSTKDYAALKSEADLARNIVESKPLTEAEVKAAEKFIGEAPPEVVKTVLEKKYKESEIKTEEGKPDELKPLEPKLEEVRPEEVRSEEAIPKELKPEDVRPEELKPEEAKADELRPEEVRTEELKPEEVRTDELKPEEVRPEELKPEEVRSEEVRPEEPIRAETSPAEKMIKELDEIERSETPDEARRLEIVKELQDVSKEKDGVFAEIDASVEMKGKEYKAERDRLREKHGEAYDKARSITNNFDDIVSQLKEKYKQFKVICP